MNTNPKMAGTLKDRFKALEEKIKSSKSRLHVDGLLVSPWVTFCVLAVYPVLVLLCPAGLDNNQIVEKLFAWGCGYFR